MGFFAVTHFQISGKLPISTAAAIDPKGLHPSFCWAFFCRWLCVHLLLPLLGLADADLSLSIFVGVLLPASPVAI